MMQNSITMGAYGRISDIVGKMQNGTQLTTEEQGQYSNIMAMANQQISTQKAFAETQMAEMQQQIQDKYESMREAMLEPLKDEEESLQTEKELFGISNSNRTGRLRSLQEDGTSRCQEPRSKLHRSRLINGLIKQSPQDFLRAFSIYS